MSIRLADLAVRFGCDLAGEPNTEIREVAPIHRAGPGDICFLASARFHKFLGTTEAAAVILDENAASDCPIPALITPNPYAIYARVADLLHPLPLPDAGVHAAANVAPDARISDTCQIAAGVVVDRGAQIGERVLIGPGCVVAENAVVGDDSRLVANVTLCHDVVIGKRATIHPGTVIGADGFGLARDDAGWIKVPQLGTVRIGDDVEIGALTTIDRGALEDTIIEDGVKLDNQIMVAHNVRIGEHTAIAGCTGISGSTTIGKRCLIGGGAGFVGHLTVCDDVIITGQTLVNRSISEPGTFSSALPMDDAKRWRRNAARFRKLDEFVRRVIKLERAAAPDKDESDD